MPILVGALIVGFAILQILQKHRENKLRQQLSEMQSRAVELERRTEELLREVDAARSTKMAAAAKPSNSLLPQPIPPPKPRASGSGGGKLMLRPRSGDPAEARRQIRAVNGESLDRLYAALYEQLGWSAAERQKFKELMLDSEESAERLFKAAVGNARTKSPEISRYEVFEIYEATKAQVQVERSEKLRELFGDSVTQAVNEFEATLPLRAVVGRIESVTTTQGNQLIDIMARNARNEVGLIDLVALNIDTVVEQASQVLSPQQVTDFRRVAGQLREQARAERERNTASSAALKSSGRK